MPTKHVLKTYSAPAYYHVYNRASGERKLFCDTADRKYFLHLLKKHLAEVEPGEDEEGVKKYEIEVVAYCLMGTHFHLLVYQEQDVGAIVGYMRSVGTGYSMYYNKKYKSKGHVFQSSYRASHVTNEPYLAHITRYIHLNPRHYDEWPWSSYQDYIGRTATDWVHPERVLEVNSNARYEKFVVDYAQTDKRKQYSDLAGQLAL